MLTSNNALQRAGEHRGRPVLATGWRARRAEWASCPPLSAIVRAKGGQLTHRRHVYTLRLCGFPGMKRSVVSN